VSAVKGTKAKITDTRKTTPGMRLLEKWAVVAGGGENHRWGLYDMILVKDNHVDYAGGIIQALKRVEEYKNKQGLQIKVEIETRNLEEVKQVLQAGGADRIMLDNFTPQQLRYAVQLVNGALETEASGGITLDNVRQYAETGVDFISVGALTHSYYSLDMSLKAET
jgi:nicotinate-nucleotide pyrophosphorylase (carboxylating)